jgi:hypothetical protein
MLKKGAATMSAQVICPNCGCSFELSREDVAQFKIRSLARGVYSRDLHGYHELANEADAEHYELRCACSTCGRCACTVFFIEKSTLDAMVGP